MCARLAVFTGWLFLTSFCISAPLCAADKTEDPLAPVLKNELRSSVALVLETYRTRRKYRDHNFPMPPDEFARFRDEVIGRLAATLGMQEWQVRNPQGNRSPVAGRFRDRLLATIEHHGIAMEVHVVEISETGDKVPLVVCLPAGEGVHPGVCVFSGHSSHGLRDLVLDLDSYQRGIATRLAHEGFVAVAVEKIDAGYLARDFGDGVDENEIATTRLAWGQLTRAHQLIACVAACEILAMHPRVDETRIGATGVSLGGWLSVQTALLNYRIAAVADFGRKTRDIPAQARPEEFRGLFDLCHILPGMLSLCDRNLLSLAYCPRPMLAGHGRRDAGSHREGPVHFQSIYAAQYEALGAADRFEYSIHDGGDTMPDRIVIDYFRRRFLDAGK